MTPIMLFRPENPREREHQLDQVLFLILQNLESPRIDSPAAVCAASCRTQHGLSLTED